MFPVVVGLMLVLSAACGGTEKVVRADQSVFDYEETMGLEVTEEITVERGSVTIRHIGFPSPKGGEVTALIVQPADGVVQAGVVLQHGMPGKKSDVIRLGELFACSGAAVIAIDAPFARWENRFRDPLTYTTQDRDEQIQLIVDLRRSIDVLKESIEMRSDLIGYMGISYGAAMGGLLAGVEDRLEAFALAVGDGGLVAHHVDADGRLLWGLADVPLRQADAWLSEMEPIEPALFVGDASVPILFSNARGDEFVAEEDAVAFHQAAGPDHEVAWYDTSHSLPQDAINDQIRWMAGHLNLDDDRVEGCLQ